MAGVVMRNAAAVLIALCAAAVQLGGAPFKGQEPQPRPSRAGSPISVDDLMRLRTIVDAKISPDGRRVAYVVSQPSAERNVHQASLFVTSVDGGTPVQLAGSTPIFTPALPVPRLRWLASDRVSFLGTVEARPQVHAVSARGGPVEVVTAAPNGVAAYEWARDGSTLAYTMREAALPSPVTHVGAPPPPVRLWVQAGKAAARALTPAGHYVDSFGWASTDALVYAAAPTVGFMAPYYTRLYEVSVASGPPRAIVDRPGMNTSPQVSPDGTQIAFVTTSERVGLIAPRGLAVLRRSREAGAPAAGSIRSYPMNGAWISEMVWAPDSQSLFVSMNEGTFATGAQMFEMPIVRVRIDSGLVERVVAEPVVNYSISISRDGRTLAYRQVEARTMGDVVVRDLATNRVTPVTRVNPELSGFDLGTLEPISWRASDGVEIWGLLLTPAQYRTRAQKLPLLVYCHGGPIGGVTLGIFPQFMHTVAQVDPYPVEAFASAGYAVLFPMPRGGSGYGESGHRVIINGWGEVDYGDIMAGVDHVVARGIADPDRLGVLGASYGGFMTNWIVTQTSRFKAASSSASISDLTDLYYLADAGAVMEEYFGRPWENRASYEQHSPLTFVEKVTTPLLLQHGENDQRVPIAGGRRFYEALRALDKAVEFDVFPGGGHVQYRPAAQRASMQRNLEWFLRWIAP
ncbi:MAG: S9 family peptidase [Acidobacteriota bacterium]